MLSEKNQQQRCRTNENLKRNLCGCCPKRINRRDVEQMQPKFEKKSVWMLSKKNQQERCRTNAA